MLQINTGKLFSRPVERTNRLTGILYSNARLPHNSDIVTRAGTLRSTGSGPADLAIVYELEERLEAGPEGPSVLVSHTVTPYLDDFAVVASFGLGAVVARSEEAVRTLTDRRPGVSSHAAPDQFVSRNFDQTVYLSEQEANEFERFVEELLALDRKTFLGAMRAMRTFVAGLYRIREDLAQAYTLMVSSVESLAQNFDDFVPVWSDMPPGKRAALDRVLENVDEPSAAEVRRTLLSFEHIALAQRYRAFALSHIDDAFIHAATKSERPMAGYELEPGLRHAYEFRSAYVHRVRQLPDELTYPHAHMETTAVNRRPALTFEGLSRVTRQVIRSFVHRGPKVEHEVYDYSRERSGIVMMEWAPQYWIWKPIYHPSEASRRLEGLLNIVCSVWMQESGAQLVDIRSALADAERLLPQASGENRMALLSLHILFNVLISKEERTPRFDKFIEKYGEEAGRPTSVSVAVASLLNATGDWSVDEHKQVLGQYFRKRITKSGLHAPRLVEAAMCLVLAEKFRLAGDEENAQKFVRAAFDVHPSCQALRGLESSFSVTRPVEWQEILLPSRSQGNDGEDGEPNPPTGPS